MKIRDILKEKEDDWKQYSKDFKSKVTNRNKTTGSVTWDVKYTPLVALEDNIEETLENFKKVTREYPQDAQLEKLYKVFTSLKRPLKTHMNRKYAE